MIKSTALPSWMYGDPLKIADGLRACTERHRKDAERKVEIARKHKSRRIKALVKKAKQGGHHA